jgi:two-component system NtrC family sensor kinase
VRARVHGLLLLYALALAATAGVSVLALGLPLAARRALGPSAVAALAGAVSLAVLALAVVLLSRGVGTPLERLLRAASRLGRAGRDEALPPLGEPGGFALSRAAVAFERVAAALAEERARLASKVDELTATNAALAEARESLLRSEKLATVGRLAAGLAHEVGNPLGAVSGYVELARTRLPPDAHPDLVDALGRIDVAAGRIDRIVRDLLDEALRLARVQARFKRVGVDVGVPGDLPQVEADEHHLAQVLVNLLLNAGDAMGGTGRVRIAGRPDGARVLLTVEDSGPGISPADLPRIFDPFFTTKPVGLGTGLGLSICHGIVTTFGGNIAAYSEPDRGTTFRVLLPTSETVAGDAPISTSRPPPSQGGKRARVLVIDDELPIANTLRDLLAPEHLVVAAVSAREGLAKLDAEPFDVVFCDLMMPGMSGIELYERVRAERPGFEERIVFMTGGAFTTRAAEFLASVDNLRVEKPFSLGLIESIVRDMAAGGGPRAARHRSG